MKGSLPQEEHLSFLYPHSEWPTVFCEQELGGWQVPQSHSSRGPWSQTKPSLLKFEENQCEDLGVGDIRFVRLQAART